ncbi:MAG TPA: APC family permease, partial [Streptosporangiaceae bacterium]
TWASETSIIGSGWLFGALFAAQAVGGAAILDWIIAGIVVMVLGLVYAELGAMYPVAGGTGRFPHFAFGSAAGVGFGFFAYLQAVTIAPIECFAFMQYASFYWPSIYDAKTSNVTGVGFILTIVLMAIFTAVNFLAMRIFARVNNVLTWWKVAVPVLAIIVLLFKFHGGNFTAGGAGFMPGGAKALFSALPAAGIIFAYSGFEQADQLAGEVKEPQKNLPRAIILAVTIGIIVYCLLQFAFIGAMPPNLLGKGFAGITNTQILSGPFAGLAGVVGLAWLAFILRIDAFISPSGTGLIYVTGTSRVSYGLARNRYFPSVFGRVDRNGIPWFGIIAALPPHLLGHGLTGLVCPSTGTCSTPIAQLNAGPFAAVASLAALVWLAHILRVDAFVSPSGTGLIYTTGTSRVSYGLARNRYAPQIFGKIDKNGVPWVGLIGAFLIGLLFLLPFPSWHSLVGLITGASVLMYAGAPLSLGAFRRQIPEADRPYRMQAAWFLAPAAFVVADLLIYWSGFEVIWKLGVVLVIGY